MTRELIFFISASPLCLYQAIFLLGFATWGLPDECLPAREGDDAVDDTGAGFRCSRAQNEQRNRQDEQNDAGIDLFHFSLSSFGLDILQFNQG